jgi:hypothetical protein
MMISRRSRWPVFIPPHYGWWNHSCCDDYSLWLRYSDIPTVSLLHSFAGIPFCNFVAVYRVTSWYHYFAVLCFQLYSLRWRLFYVQWYSWYISLNNVFCIGSWWKFCSLFSLHCSFCSYRAFDSCHGMPIHSRWYRCYCLDGTFDAAIVPVCVYSVFVYSTCCIPACN